jgi:aminoacylase
MDKIFKFRDEQIKQLAGRVDQIGKVTSVNVTKMDGGVQTNVIPNTASISIWQQFEYELIFVAVDVRISPLLGQEGFQKVLDDWINQDGLELEIEEKAPLPPASPVCADDRYYSIIASTLYDFAIEHRVEIFPGATDSRYIRDAGIPAYGLSPFNNTPILLHDHNEYLHKDVFLKGVEIYEKLIAKLSSP